MGDLGIASAILFSTTSIDFSCELHFLEGYSIHTVVSNSFAHNTSNSFVYSNNIYQMFYMYHVLYGCAMYRMVDKLVMTLALFILNG